MNLEDIFICTTDTVTGIGGPINEQTLETIYFLKKRPKNKKIMILVGSLDQAKSFKEWNNLATETALKYWPGAYSIIINNQGFRMPNLAPLNDFLLKNGPMYVTSANISGKEPIKIEDVTKVFPEVKNIYNFGQGTNEASTLINLDNGEIIKR
ncbi:Sua5/YciO/YrdC/YwlC family protein [Mycoplasmopsis lipophila]|uniref:Sua5/YciO/YrdC/YwlC family protein n=1 Tax=Mycoplasmopsis lipophila TaxID=2117 RepID=UPI0038731CBD